MNPEEELIRSHEDSIRHHLRLDPAAPVSPLISRRVMRIFESDAKLKRWRANGKDRRFAFKSGRSVLYDWRAYLHALVSGDLSAPAQKEEKTK